MPNVPITGVIVDGADDIAHGVDLVWAHHEDFGLGLHQHHIAAEHLAKRAFGQEELRKVVQVVDFGIVFPRPGIHRQKLLFSVEGEVAVVIVREVVGLGLVADDENLQKAEQRVGVAVARVGLIGHNLFEGFTGIHGELLQLDLNNGNAVEEQHDVIAVKAVGGVDAQLPDHLERVLAPVPGVDKCEVERCAVFAFEGVRLAEVAGCEEDVGRDDLLKESVEFLICELDAVQNFEFLAEVAMQGVAVADVVAIGVLEVFKGANELLLKDGLRNGRRHRIHCNPCVPFLRYFQRVKPERSPNSTLRTKTSSFR